MDDPGNNSSTDLKQEKIPQTALPPRIKSTIYITFGIILLLVVVLFLLRLFIPAVFENSTLPAPTAETKPSPTPQISQVDRDKLLFVVTDTVENTYVERGVFYVDSKSHQITQLTGMPYEYVGLFGKYLVMKTKGTDQYFLFHPENRQYTALNLPSLSKTEHTSQRIFFNNSPITGGDQVLIYVQTFDDRNDYGFGLDFGLPVDQKSYFYSFSDNSYSEAEAIDRVFGLLGDRVDRPYGYSFLGLNEDRQQAYFQLTGEGIGNSDVVAVDLKNNHLQKIMDQNISSSISRFYLSPDLDYGFYIKDDISQLTAHLVNLSDINQSVDTYDLTAIAKKYNMSSFVDPHSFAWLDDSKKVVIGFNEVINLLDFKNDTLDILSDFSIRSGTSGWDSNWLESNGKTDFAYIKKTSNSQDKIIIHSLITKTDWEVEYDGKPQLRIIGWLGW